MIFTNVYIYGKGWVKTVGEEKKNERMAEHDTDVKA